MQGQCPQRLPIAQKAARKFGGNVLRIGCGSSVPGDEQLASSSEGSTDNVNRLRNGRGQVGKSSSHLQVVIPDSVDFVYLLSRAPHVPAPPVLIPFACLHEVGPAAHDRVASFQLIHELVPSSGKRSTELWKRHLSPFPRLPTKNRNHPVVLPPQVGYLQVTMEFCRQALQLRDKVGSFRIESVEPNL